MFGGDILGFLSFFLNFLSCKLEISIPYLVFFFSFHRLGFCLLDESLRNSLAKHNYWGVSCMLCMIDTSSVQLKTNFVSHSQSVPLLGKIGGY
jgi:hypothetical protein